MHKILITGAGGFIGSHLTELLVQESYEVKAFVHYNSNNDWGWLEQSKVKKELEVISGDVRDYDSVYSALKGCDAVFHLAALIGIPYSYVSPLAYIKTNIEGTYNVLEAARQLDVKNILITSTSETYGTAQYVPINEQHPVVGQSPYSATKIGADQIGVSYFRTFGTPVKIVRPFNTYGPRQSARAVIPSIIIQILAGKKEIKLGNLTPTRDLTYVKDTVRGFLEIYKSDACIGKAINIGINEEISIGGLVNLVSEIMGAEIEVQEESQRVRPNNSEVQRLVCDNTLIKKLTKWAPNYSLKEGLIETIEFIKNNLHVYKSDIYNI